MWFIRIKEMVDPMGDVGYHVPEPSTICEVGGGILI